MSQHLVLTVRLHDQRYHGAPEWPPAPARVFQALVAGATRGNVLRADAISALEWLESLPPPVIAAPHARMGHRVEMFVPNNDADAVGGDPRKIADIRTRKLVQPRLLDGESAFIYAWRIVGEPEPASTILEVATDLYQLGRGIDMAWAVGEIVDDEVITARLGDHRGTIHRPGGSTEASSLPCPAVGSLESLTRRHRANITKMRLEGVGSAARMLFSQPPKPRFIQVGYEAEGQSLLYELRDRQHDLARSPWPLSRIVALTERLRNGAAARMREAFPEQHDVIERALIGRKADGRDDGPIAERVRIVPLPSIGHEHVDRSVRRVVVEVPVGCSFSVSDVDWAFSGLETTDPTTGETDSFVLTPTPTGSDNMLRRFQAESGARRWRSVTAAALPMSAQRRRIDPSRQRAEAKGAGERMAEESSAVGAVHAALRHAGIHAHVVDVMVQREPFSIRGARAEAFGTGTRFAKERLWHVGLELSEPVHGPLLIGDGRFLGLGLMAPVFETEGIFAFSLHAEHVTAINGSSLVRAMRRAVMSRAQAALGSRTLSRFFSGHEPNGDPARSEQSSHVSVQWDSTRQRLLVIAPHVLDHRFPVDDEVEELDILNRALEGFIDLRAGRAGRFQLSRCSSAETDEYRERAKSWISVRPYSVTRHAKAGSAAEALTEDVIMECRRRALPRPEVTVIAGRGAPGRGLEGNLRLDFAVAVDGPLVLGRTRYLGGGLFLGDRSAHRTAGR